MKNFLYFLLGFTIFFCVPFYAYAAYPGLCSGVFYVVTEPTYTYTTNFASHLTFIETITYNQSNGSLSYTSTPWPGIDTGQPYSAPATDVQMISVFKDSTNHWTNVGVATTLVRLRPAAFAQLQAIGKEVPSLQDSNYTCPQTCFFPNAVDPSGNCVPCPSGTFSIGTNVCVPLCNYGHPYIPGQLYNPADGQGTCVAPPCGSGQIANSEGRCVPNCPTDKKLDIVTGACVADCPYGTHWDTATSTCKNDCPTGQMKDAETGSCIQQYNCDQGYELVNGKCATVCLPGEARDHNGKCISAEPNCPFGQHKENGVCVANPVTCPVGSTWDAATVSCKVTPIQNTEHKTVVNNTDGTVTNNNTQNITISNGNGGNLSGSVNTTTIINPGTGESNTTTTITPPAVQKYKSPEHKLNWDGWNSQIKRASTDGPVKLLEHVKEIVSWLDIPPQAPSIDGVIWGHTLHFDLHAFDGIAEMCRFFLSCFMTIGVFWFGFRLFGIL